MADFMNPLGDLAFQGAGYWVMLAINMFLSTIVGGFVLMAIISMITKKSGESVQLSNVFLLSLLINAINSFGVLGFLSPVLPLPGLLIQLLVWIGLVKLFFSNMSMVHVVIAAVAGFAITIFVVPIIVGIITPVISAFNLVF
jgi:hypothetical protein